MTGEDSVSKKPRYEWCTKEERGSTYNAIPEIAICLVAVAEVDEGAVAGGDSVLIVPDALLAVRRVLEHGPDMLGRVGEGALSQAALRSSAVPTESSVGIPHVGAEEVAGVGVLLLIPPRHGAGVVALVAHQGLEGVHHHAVPREELAHVVDDVAVDGVGVGPVGSLEITEARGLMDIQHQSRIARILEET